MKIWSGYESMERIILGLCAFNAQAQVQSLVGKQILWTTQPGKESAKGHLVTKYLYVCCENMQIPTLGRGSHSLTTWVEFWPEIFPFKK